MAKTQFRYNPKSLSYEKVKRSGWEKLLRGFIVIAPSLLIGLMIGIFASYHLDSPKEKKLARENKELKSQFKKVQGRLALINKVTKSIQQRDEDLYRVALGAKQIPQDLLVMGTGGSDAYASYRDMSDGQLLIQTYKELDGVERKLHAQSLSFATLTKLARRHKERLASIPAIQPVSDHDLKRIASGFGWRVDPIYGTRKMHPGLDFAANKGTKIYATGAGKIIYAQHNNWGYGNEVVINHGFGYKTRYGHMSKILVKSGQRVKRGQLIGLVGSTGKSTGPHCHYEVIKDGRKVNPINYFHADLTPEQYEEITTRSKNALKSMD